MNPKIPKEVKNLLNKKDHTRTDEDWDAIYDARSLARYQELINDPSRLKKAKLWAQVLAIREQKEADAMKKAAS